MTTRVSVYIDGFNLHYSLKEKGWHRYYWLNPYTLGEKLLRPNQQLSEVKYFTARIRANSRYPNMHLLQAHWLEAIIDSKNTMVYFGHFLAKQRQCPRCQARWASPEEKMTDVNIAVELLRDAYEDKFDLALVISADSDLAPPITAVHTGFPEKRVMVLFPPDRNSHKLQSVANASFMIGRKTLKDSQFPDEYKKADGYVLKRPPSWN